MTEWFWAAPRMLRSLVFGLFWAVGIVVVGKLVTATTGFWCSCWIGNLRLGALAGGLGGVIFGIIHEPRPFERRADG